MTLAIDGAVEDAVFAELEALGVGLCAVSEERGLVEIAAAARSHVVIDPIDGSLNAKRRLPFYSLSIAVADGDDMASVVFGYVANFPTGEEWWAARGEGAYLGGERLEPADARRRARDPRRRVRPSRGSWPPAADALAADRGTPAADDRLDRAVALLRRLRALRRHAVPAPRPLGRRRRRAS